MELQRSAFLGEVREVKEAEGVLVHPISSSNIDSHGTIVWPHKVKWGDKEYKPVGRGGGDYIPVIDEHGSWFGDTKILGVNKGLDETEEDGVKFLMAVTEFDLESPVGAERFRQHKKGIKKGWSIGFVPSRTLKDDEANEFLKAQGVKARDVTVYLGAILWEYSSVLWPSNPDAYNNSAEMRSLIQEALKAESVSKDDINELKQRIVDLENRLNETGEIRKKDMFETLADTVKGA